MIDKFKNFSRGDIRKEADRLLGNLQAAYLGNIAFDNKEKILKSLEDIKNSDIDWDKDVVNSVKEKYKNMTNPETINKHLSRWES
jgi:hypothetical protein